MNINGAKIVIEHEGRNSMGIEIVGTQESIALAVAMAMHKNVMIAEIFKNAVRAFDMATEEMKRKTEPVNIKTQDHGQQ